MLFAEKGFGGATVRDICRAAGTSGNMIHHYFGDKQGLLDAIVDQYGTGVFDRALTLLDPPLTSREDFAARFRLLFITTLEACMELRLPMLVALREQVDLTALARFQERFARFVLDAQDAGWVRPAVRPELVSGIVLDRITNYVQFAPWTRSLFGVDPLGDREYRQQWTEANVDLFLHGFVAD